MVVRATDDEQLAHELWGSDCKWDEDRQQYVPTEVNKLADVADHELVDEYKRRHPDVAKKAEVKDKKE